MKQKKPTKAQIRRFVKYVKSLAFYYAVKQQQDPPDPDLVAVMEWLEDLSND
jgi:hypothetical protein